MEKAEKATRGSATPCGCGWDTYGLPSPDDEVLHGFLHLVFSHMGFLKEDHVVSFRPHPILNLFAKKRDIGEAHLDILIVRFAPFMTGSGTRMSSESSCIGS